VSPGGLGGGESLRIVLSELRPYGLGLASKWISYDEHMLGVCLSGRRVEVGNGEGRKKRGVVRAYARRLSLLWEKRGVFSLINSRGRQKR
jgi:hypothetical protein